MTEINNYIGNYRVLSQIPNASDEDTYIAEHTYAAGAPVKIKVWRAPDLSSEERNAALQELQSFARLHHPNILSFIESGVEGDKFYLVTAYLGPQAETLRNRIKKQALPPLTADESLAIIADVGRALHYAHQQNILHLHLMPEHILFEASGEALLCDFGVAAFSDTTLRKVTLPLNLSERYIYMAPEQLHDQTCKASDQYALGCIAYELFTGHMPQPSSQTLVPPRQLNGSLPEYIEQAILKAMAMEPADRFPDVGAFIAALGVVNETQAAVLDEPTLRPFDGPTLVHSDTGTVASRPFQVYPRPYGLPVGMGNFQAPGTLQRPFQALRADIGNKWKAPLNDARNFATKRPKLIALILLIILVPPLLYYALTLIPASAATITITPISKRITTNYTINAVLGTPGSSQAPAYMLTFTSTKHSKTVPASGRGHQNAIAAKGTLTISQAGQNTNIAPNQTLTGFDGVKITIDSGFGISVGQTVKVAAHATQTGSGGNIGTDDIDSTVDVINTVTQQIITTAFVENQQPFTGGQDAFDYTFVKQSDIDSVANPLLPQLTQEAQAGVQKQIQTNQKTAANVQCNPNVKPNHQVNDRVSDVTVDVSVTCLQEVYIPQEIQLAAVNAFKSAGLGLLGNNYVVVGNVVTGTPEQDTQLTTTDGTLIFHVKADGIWVYSFSDQQRQQMVQLIMGKPQSSATDTLLHQSGVNKIAIVTSGGLGWAIPTEVQNIKVAVVTIPGLMAA